MKSCLASESDPLIRQVVSRDRVKIRQMFGNIAGTYDYLNRILSFGLDASWRRRAARLSGIKPGNRVLDVCCGTADLALAFAKEMRQKGLVVATDFTPEMLAIARDKTSESIINLGRADTLQLPFADNTFDVCSAGWGIRNVEDFRDGFLEMYRVLKPGGRAAILESTAPGGRLAGRLFNFYFTRIMPWLGNLLSRSPQKAYSYLCDSVCEFPDAAALKHIMEDVGYTKVDYQLKGFGAIAIHIGIK
ncbi:bifunctional demethylmenaquinone methyltransferase/2-methoxy-6-polyprenyl-1,4-benzoquinol methylase UbiE [Planctomycetota bacterium]